MCRSGVLRGVAEAVPSWRLPTCQIQIPDEHVNPVFKKEKKKMCVVSLGGACVPGWSVTPPSPLCREDPPGS